MTTTKQKQLSIHGKHEYQNVVGMLSANQAGFSDPVSIDFRSDGVMYVASRGNHNQPEAVRVTICTTEGQYLDQFGRWGEEPGTFIWVTSIAFDKEDKLFLADEHNHKISVFEADGTFLRWFGTHGDGPGELNRPSGIAFDKSGNLLVVDSLNHRVQRLDEEGNYLGSWGTYGKGEGQFSMPWGVTVDSKGDVYVTDWRNDRVQKFHPDGTFLMAFGESGSGEGQFDRPNGVAVDRDGDIYVCDWRNDRVQVFDSGGKYQDTIQGHGGMSTWAREYLNANPLVEVALNKATQNIPIKERFYRPTDVTTDDQGRVFVVDTYRHRVQIYQKL